MSLVYLSGNPTEKEVIECKNKLVEIGHSVVVVEKFDWNILCRCDCLVVIPFSMVEKSSIDEYEYSTNVLDIPSFIYPRLPELEQHEIVKPTITRMTVESSMKEYRNNIVKMNFGEFIGNEKVLSVSYENVSA